MVSEFRFSKQDLQDRIKDLKKDWENPSKKVFVLSPMEQVENPRDFYEDLFPLLGTPFALAEDVKQGDRYNQRTGQIWMEVRYDPNHPDAYRHSPNAQPLHTDGSYIPDFPSSTILVCQANAGEGGETTFLDSNDLFAIMKKEKPELLNFFLHHKISHKRSGDQRIEPILQIKDDQIFLNYNFYCVDPELSDSERNKINEFQEFLLTNENVQKATTGIKLEPGEAVFWKDDLCLHGRNAFQPKKISERFIWKCAIDIFKF